MTTYEYASARARSVLGKAGMSLAPVWRAVHAGARGGWAKVRPVAMTGCGLSCITAGLFTVSTLAGLIGAGVSFFVLDWLREHR